MRLRKDPPASHFKLRKPNPISARESSEDIQSEEREINCLYSLPCKKKKLKKDFTRHRVSGKEEGTKTIVVRIVEVVLVKEEEMESESTDSRMEMVGGMEGSQYLKSQNIKVEWEEPQQHQGEHRSDLQSDVSAASWQSWQENAHFSSRMADLPNNFEKDFLLYLRASD